MPASIFAVAPDRHTDQLVARAAARLGVGYRSVRTFADVRREAAGGQVVAVSDADRLRGLPPREQRSCFLLALHSQAEHGELARLVEDVADDFLARPFTEAMLVSRLRAAVRFTRNGRVHSLRRTLREACGHAGGGEVVVRADERVARIFVSKHRIAWIHLADNPISLLEILAPEGSTPDRDAARAVLEESRRSGRHVVEIASEWGLAERSEVLGRMRSAVAARLRAVRAWEEPTSIFVPDARPASGVGFSASELSHASLVPPPPLDPEPPADDPSSGTLIIPLRDLVVEIARWGVSSFAVFRRQSGACLLEAGTPINREIAWSLQGTLAALGPGAEDVAATADELTYVVRAVPSSPDFAILVAAPHGPTAALIRARLKLLLAA